MSARHTRHDSQRSLGQGKTGMTGSISKIAGQRQFDPTSKGSAVDRTQQGCRAIDQRAGYLFKYHVLGIPLVIAHTMALLEITTGAKRAITTTGEYDAPGLART